MMMTLPGRDSPRYLVTGRAVPPTYEDRASARAAFHLAAGDVCVLVFGGSLGARSINEAAVRAFADAPYRILHIAGGVFWAGAVLVTLRFVLPNARQIGPAGGAFVGRLMGEQGLSRASAGAAVCSTTCNAQTSRAIAP